MTGDPFHYSPARVVIARAGGFIEAGEAVEITLHEADGVGVVRAVRGTCPECARLPLNDEPIVCAHGVAVRPRP